jgi:hypothetical protein
MASSHPFSNATFLVILIDSRSITTQYAFLLKSKNVVEMYSNPLAVGGIQASNTCKNRVASNCLWRERNGGHASSHFKNLTLIDGC